jgi:hypothetical protein
MLDNTDSNQEKQARAALLKAHVQAGRARALQDSTTAVRHSTERLPAKESSLSYLLLITRGTYMKRV